MTEEGGEEGANDRAGAGESLPKTQARAGQSEP
jgi:hypothetical protein